MNQQKGYILPVILIILAATAGIGYWVYKNKLLKPVAQNDLSSPSLSDTWKNEVTPTPGPNSDLKTYTYDKYGFEFKYPNDWGTQILEFPNEAIITLNTNIDSPHKSCAMVNCPAPFDKYVVTFSIAEKKDDFYVYEIKHSRKTILAKRVAYQKIMPDNAVTPLDTYITLSDEDYLKITLSPFSNNPVALQSQIKNYYDQILSSLKIFYPLDPSTPVMKIYPGKVVYGTKLSTKNLSLAKKDCIARSGSFNTCGTVCEPRPDCEAEICAATCEY